VAISKKRCLQSGILVVLLVFCLVNARLIWSFIKPTWGFKALASDVHVLYEPGAEDLAKELSLSLPSSLNQIEKEQFKPFKTPVFLYVCSTPSSFAEFTILDGATAACTSPDRVFVSPTLATKEHIEKISYMTHELSHAHLQQYMGTFAFRLNYPNWFKEGLAAYVSDGGGAGMVSDRQAAAFICSGRVFEPVDKPAGNRLDLIPIQSSRFSDLKPFPKPIHMFYHQSMMFISYLKQRDPAKFEQFVESIENGGNFRNCFISIYGQDVRSVFNQFVEYVRKTGMSGMN
jgi:hypothetical protein